MAERAVADRQTMWAAAYLTLARGHDEAVAETEEQIANLLDTAERHYQ